MEQDDLMVNCVDHGHAATMDLISSTMDRMQEYHIHTFECPTCHHKVDVSVKA